MVSPSQPVECGKLSPTFGEGCEDACDVSSMASPPTRLIGVGTGSGLRCFMLGRLSVDYGRKSKLSCTVLQGFLAYNVYGLGTGSGFGRLQKQRRQRKTTEAGRPRGSRDSARLQRQQ